MPARWFNFLAGLVGDWISYIDEKTKHQFSVINFGATGDGVTDDTIAIKAAIAAAFAAGGGVVWFPAGTYVTTDTLAVPRGVSLHGVPGASYLEINHATKDLLSLTSNNTHLPTVVSGLGLAAVSITNTGTLVTNPVGSNLLAIFENCELGDFTGLHTGKLAYIEGASRVVFLNCHAALAGNVAGFSLTSAFGQLDILGGRITAPATFSNTLVSYALGAGKLSTTFDFRAHSSGANAKAIGISSGTDTPVVVTGCTFYGSVAGPEEYALSADSGVNLLFKDNAFHSINRFGAIGLLADGSEVDLEPNVNESVGTNSYTVPNGVEAVSVWFDTGATSPADVALPAILAVGQELDLLVYHAISGAFTVTLSNYGVREVPPAMSGLDSISARFVAMRPGGALTPSWVQVGGWASP